MSTPSDKNNSFVERLQRTIDNTRNRGNRAALRRYWSPTTRHQSYPVLGRLGALSDDRLMILSALYAEHPNHQQGISIGKAALGLGKRKEGEHPYDRHFRRLLSCDDIKDLAQQLHRLVKRLSREGVGIDYELLHKNLNYWAGYSEGEKLRWAADFWQAPIPESSTSPSES